MALHNTTGKVGETIAKQHLQENNYKILESNWRYKNWEIDIIAAKHDVLHFFEVKTNGSNNLNHLPEQRVSKKKMQFLMQAADAYLQRNTTYKKIQFNIIAIQLFSNKSPEITLIEDVYM